MLSCWLIHTCEGTRGFRMSGRYFHHVTKYLWGLTDFGLSNPICPLCVSKVAPRQLCVLAATLWNHTTNLAKWYVATSLLLNAGAWGRSFPTGLDTACFLFIILHESHPVYKRWLSSLYPLCDTDTLSPLVQDRLRSLSYKVVSDLFYLESKAFDRHDLRRLCYCD